MTIFPFSKIFMSLDSNSKISPNETLFKIKKNINVKKKNYFSLSLIIPIIQIKIKINNGKALESNIGTLSLTPNKFEK